MPNKRPEPITPEGKRAAERVRLIFFSIAAANLVFVVIVMWQRNSADKSQEADSAKPAAAEGGKRNESP